MCSLRHDADIITALSAIGLRNSRVVGDERLESEVVSAVNTYYAGDPKLDKIFEDRMTMRPQHWRNAFVSVRGNFGGGESRGTLIQMLVIKNLHRGFKTRLRLES